MDMNERGEMDVDTGVLTAGEIGSTDDAGMGAGVGWGMDLLEGESMRIYLEVLFSECGCSRPESCRC